MEYLILNDPLKSFGRVVIYKKCCPTILATDHKSPKLVIEWSC